MGSHLGISSLVPLWSIPAPQESGGQSTPAPQESGGRAGNSGSSSEPGWVSCAPLLKMEMGLRPQVVPGETHSKVSRKLPALGGWSHWLLTSWASSASVPTFPAPRLWPLHTRSRFPSRGTLSTSAHVSPSSHSVVVGCPISHLIYSCSHVHFANLTLDPGQGQDGWKKRGGPGKQYACFGSPRENRGRTMHTEI